jgi:hypothetical protein
MVVATVASVMIGAFAGTYLGARDAPVSGVAPNPTIAHTVDAAAAEDSAAQSPAENLSQ